MKTSKSDEAASINISRNDDISEARRSVTTTKIASLSNNVSRMTDAMNCNGSLSTSHRTLSQKITSCLSSPAPAAIPAIQGTTQRLSG
jgi:hypothetical protein